MTTGLFKEIRRHSRLSESSQYDILSFTHTERIPLRIQRYFVLNPTPAMKRFLFILIAFCSCFSLAAQSAEGRYNSRMTRDGTLFFIMPHKISKLEGLKKFQYDMTLLNWTDSTTINFTFESSSVLLPEDLEIKSGQKSFACTSYSPLFVDIKKNHYEIRITSKFPNSQIKDIIQNSLPPVFSFRQGDEIKTASYKPGAWTKDRKKLNDIFQLYTLSK